MATKITNTKELSVELLDKNGAYGRTIKVLNPVNNITRQTVISALAPAIAARAGADTDSAVVAFFRDDADFSKELTTVGKIEIVETTKSVTEVE